MVVNVERVQIVTAEPVPEAPADAPSRPDGPLAAALLAAGIGSLALGLLTTLAEASQAFRERLILNGGVGPLSGKTVWATVVFVVAWVVLSSLLREKDRILRSATIAFVILTILGLLGTFPIFFQAFAPAG
ncbi:MAG: hypothetical protein U0031_01530 [Thermomicrobiales bacterium]